MEGGYNEGGKGPATTDRGAGQPGIADNKVAANHYHHREEDVDLMAELGLKVYRMGFSWSRIMPDTSGNPNPEGLAFYDQLIDYLLEQGIEPLVTLYHFECPQALVDAFGGWLDRQMIDHYLRYAEVCFDHFKGRVKRWVTVNEQLIATAAGIMNGNHETDPQKNLQNIYQMSYHVSLAEHKAMALLRQIDPEAQIGPVCAIQVVYPYSSRAEDVLAAENAEELMEFYLLDLSVRGEYPPYVASYLKSHGLYPETRPEDAAVLKSSTPDFIGINYYFSICVKAKEGPVNYHQPPFWVSDAFDICDNPYLKTTEWMDKGIDPVGLRIGMRKVYNRYRLTMIVTENGMAYSETLGADGCIHDPYCIEYLQEHIEQIGIMIQEGLPVFGYCPWSFVDVVSSHQGFAKRYGLVYVDRTETDPKQCARVKKDSFYWYQKVIAQNGLPEQPITKPFSPSFIFSRRSHAGALYPTCMAALFCKQPERSSVYAYRLCIPGGLRPCEPHPGPGD